MPFVKLAEEEEELKISYSYTSPLLSNVARGVAVLAVPLYRARN